MTAVQAPKRVRLPSTSSVLEAIVPRPGLVPWTETQTVEGVLTLLRAGEPVDRMFPREVLAAMRDGNVGAAATRDTSARRGVNVHALLEQYARTGSLPDPIGLVEPDDYGYVHGLDAWLYATQPEPLVVEQIVCDPVAGYAGRLDLVAQIGDARTLVDLKTSERAAIWDAAHLQTALYARAEALCGGDPVDRILIVVVAKDGTYREMLGMIQPDGAQAALDWWHALRPVTAACTAANKIERDARQNPADKPPPAAKVELVPGDPSTVPGAMQKELSRTLPDGGLLTYESAPAGWTTQAGTRRRADWRAYWYEPPAQGALELAA